MLIITIEPERVICYCACMSSANHTLAGIAALLPYLPVSAIERASKGEGSRGAAAGLTTDAGRGLGSTAGLAAVIQGGHDIPNRNVRMALALAGLGAGGLAGHIAGDSIGETIFQPKKPRTMLGGRLLS